MNPFFFTELKRRSKRDAFFSLSAKHNLREGMCPGIFLFFLNRVVKTSRCSETKSKFGSIVSQCAFAMRYRTFTECGKTDVDIKHSVNFGGFDLHVTIREKI